MEHCNIISPSVLPVESESDSQSSLEAYHQPNSMSDTTSDTTYRKKGIPLYAVIIGLLLIMLLTSWVQLHQYRVYSDAVEQEAYLLSVTINLLEDNLLIQYGIFPEEVGLDNLRSAWISNPCYETAIAYYEALSDFFEHFDQYTEPHYDFEPIQV